MKQAKSSRSRWRLAAIAATSVALLATACGGGSDEGGNGGGGGNPEPSGEPTPGGSVTYALEAENGGGWCLPEGQLAISGIQVARAVYDTLTVPNEKAEYKPFLAQSVEHNENYTEWTIKLREGITFHDGTALDATVVKNNLEAYMGKYPGRTALLFMFILQNLSSVEVVDPMTVKATTATPWPSFDAYLYSSGRLGIMAQAQLDDPTNCDKNLIGTGPFAQKEWKPNEKFVGEKNPNYWLKGAKGEQLPYLDELTFVPIPDGSARVNALLAGDVQALHATGAPEIVALREASEAGEINLVESDQLTEVSYGMLNNAKPPFDNINARKAVAYGLDRATLNDVMFEGIFDMASGPFAPGEIGYLEDAGFPEYDLDKAKEYAAKYTEETGLPFEFTIAHTNDPTVTKTVQYLQQSAQDAGMKVNLKSFEQAALISTALSGDWQILAWRNHPGGNPDGQYVWWNSQMPTNFSKINDPDLDRLLLEGRGTSDPAERQRIYAEINKLFGEKVYNLWLNWSLWAVGTAPDVFGVFGPPLPDGGGEPFPGLATGHSVAGLWVQR